jgi:hypothetical protein
MKENIKQLISRVTPFLKNAWFRFTQTKFYQNKRVFLPVTISVGLMVLIILVGLLFGGKKTARTIKMTPSPTPAFIQNTSAPSTGADTLSQIEQKLTDLKNQIINLDVKQSRLQPPAINFNIKF